MRHFCAVVWVLGALALVVPSSAQQAALRGFVTDGATGQALDLVNVVIEGAGGAGDGASTRADGLYQFSRLEPGAYRIRASFIGYQLFSDSLSLAEGQVLTFNIALQPVETELEEVVVESAGLASVAVPVAGLQTIRAADIDRVPTPDVSGDLASLLTTIPGVVTTGDQGGQLYIRGGEPSQNMVMLDGMLVYQPFHILGFYSAFPSDIVNRADIYAGGFGARYGGRLSSVIDIRSRDGNNQSIAGSAAVSPFMGALQLEGPLLPGKVSLLASYRRSLLDEIAGQYVNDELPFAFDDLFVKFHAKVTPTSNFSATYLKTTDAGTLEQAGGELAPDEVTWNNEVLGGRYVFLPRNVPVAAELRISHSRLENGIGPADAPVRKSSIEDTHIILSASFVGAQLNADAGMDLRTISLDSELGGLYQNVEFSNARLGNWGNYLDLDIKLGAYARLQPSLRAQFYKVRFQPYLEPRLRFVWERGGHQLSAATGIHHQEIVGLTDRRDAANVFTAWTSIPSEDARAASVDAGRIQNALHAIVGYSVDTRRGVRLSAEGFYKRMGNLLVAEWTAYPRFTTRMQPASGRSAGFDLRLDAQKGPVYVQVNYGYSATRYEAEQASLKVWYGTETLSFRPPHDRRHQLNLLAGADLAGFDLSVHWTYGAGLPYSRAIGFDGFALIDDIRNVGQIPTSRRVIYERPYNAELPSYHRLDVSLERTLTLGKTRLTAQASALNLYNRANIFYLDVFTLQRVDQLPFIPSIGLKVAFQ
ncbi:MAG: TonB-dependent receptor [Rhodothermales bacterium]